MHSPIMNTCMYAVTTRVVNWLYQNVMIYNLITWIKLNWLIIIVANHSGLSSFSAAGIWNQRSWLSKYAYSCSNFSVGLFYFYICWKNRSQVVYRIRPLYKVSLGLMVEVSAMSFWNGKDNLPSLSKLDQNKLPLLLIQAKAYRVTRLDL